MNAPLGRSQSRAGVVVLPHSVPCSADVLSRWCDIIAQAKSEGSPVTRRDAARIGSLHLPHYIGILGRHVMRFTLISDQDTP